MLYGEQLLKKSIHRANFCAPQKGDKFQGCGRAGGRGTRHQKWRSKIIIIKKWKCVDAVVLSEARRHEWINMLIASALSPLARVLSPAAARRRRRCFSFKLLIRSFYHGAARSSPASTFIPLMERREWERCENLRSQKCHAPRELD